MRNPAKVRLTALAVVALMAMGAFYVAVIAGPGIKVTRHDDQLSIEPYFLEYSLGISRVLLEDLNDRKVVLEAISKPDSVIDAIHLSPGPMNLASALGPNAQLTHVPASPAALVRGHEYRLTIWGNNGFGNTASSTATNRLLLLFRQPPNPSIERTAKSTLRVLSPAAHVKR